MTLVYLTIAWSIGIVLAHQGLASPCALGALLLGTLVIAWGRRPAQVRLLLALALALLLGCWRYALAQPLIDARHLAYYNDAGKVTVRGFISAEPSMRGTYTELELTAEELAWEGSWRPVRGKAVFDVPLLPAYQYGDRVQLTGTLQVPPVLDDFSYKEYLAARGVHSLIRRPSLTRLDTTGGSGLLWAVFGLKRRLQAVVEALWPYPDAGFMDGVLLGLNRALPDDVAEAFRRVGLTHILVISGFNMSLLMQTVLLVSRHLMPRWPGLWLSLGVIGLYTLLVGPTPPVVRAALMGGLVALGQLVGRRSHTLTGLATASLLATAYNPLLLWSVSFQLSFVAVLALVVLEPALARSVLEPLTALTGRERATRWLRLLRDLLLATLAAQLATLPVIWYHFGQVSVVSLLANVLVLPVQPALMFLGAGATVLGAFWLPAGQLAAWLAWPLLRYSLSVAQTLARWPWAAVNLPPLSPAALWAIYGAGALALWAKGRGGFKAHLSKLLARTTVNRAAFAALGLVAVLIWSAALTRPDGHLHVYMLDVGQGDALLLRTPRGRTILVDGGLDPLALRSRLGQILPFWQRQLDLVVATHADQDHLAGLIPILEHYRVCYVLEPPGLEASALGTAWRQAQERNGAKILSATRGLQLQVDQGVQLMVLHPAPTAGILSLQEDNRNSVVLRVVMGGFALLLTGDIDAQTEQALLETGLPLQATALKVAHHGAASASSARFLAAVEPQLALIGVGADNTFGHPSPQVVQRLETLGCQVYRTDWQGTIALETDGINCWVKPGSAAPSSGR